MEFNKITDCVLLLDDDPVNSFLNAQLLSRTGIANTIKVASNAIEAADFIRQCCLLEEGELNAILVFLDIDSTAYNSFELLDLMNSMANKVVDRVEVVFLSSSLEGKEIPKGNEDVVLGIMEKPLSLEKLQKMLAGKVQP